MFDYLKLAHQVINESDLKERQTKASRLSDHSRKLENKLRELYVSRPDSDILQNPYLMLIDPFQEKEIFATELQFPETILFPQEEEKKVRMVPDLKTFQEQLSLYSERQLDGLNWNNVLLAGGSVVSALTQHPHTDPTRLRQYWNRPDSAYHDGDLDLFLYGLTQEEANQKVIEIYEQVQKNTPYPVVCFRSASAVTLVSQFPFRHIQIITRLYQSPAEVLMGFDIDAATVGYDGQRVWATPRMHQAWCSNTNLVDMTRRSPSYEFRLWKYSKRGFQVGVPELHRERINFLLYERRLTRARGLGKLLLLETFADEEKRLKYQNALREARGRTPRTRTEHLSSRYTGQTQKVKWTETSDYSTVFLPWGRGWDAGKCQKIMEEKTSVLNSSWYDPEKKHPTYPCFIGTATEVLGDMGHPLPNWEALKFTEEQIQQYYDQYVIGPVRWIHHNPGQQRIGSFHPITNDEWSQGVYQDPNLSLLMQLIYSQDYDKVVTLLKEFPTLVDMKDHTGRTPFHLSILLNDFKMVELMLEFNPSINYRLSNGESVFHLAARTGEVEMAKLLYRYLERVVEDNTNGSQNDSESEEESEDEDDRFSSLKKIVEFQKKQKEAQELREDSYLQCEKSKDESVTLELINEKDWDEKISPLTLAFFNGHFALCDYLQLLPGYKKSAWHFSQRHPLLQAWEMNYLDAVDYYLQKKLTVPDEFWKNIVGSDHSSQVNRNRIHCLLRNQIDLHRLGDSGQTLTGSLISRGDHESLEELYRLTGQVPLLIPLERLPTTMSDCRALKITFDKDPIKMRRQLEQPINKLMYQVKGKLVLPLLSKQTDPELPEYILRKQHYSSEPYKTILDNAVDIMQQTEIQIKRYEQDLEKSMAKVEEDKEKSVKEDTLMNWIKPATPSYYSSPASLLKKIDKEKNHLQIWTEIVTWLKSNGYKSFLELSLTDPELLTVQEEQRIRAAKRASQAKGKGKGKSCTPKNPSVELTFRIRAESRWSRVSQEYEKLFLAAWEGDQGTLKSFFEQEYSSLISCEGKTLLELALHRRNKELFFFLLQEMKKQYPLIKTTPELETEPRNIDNLQLLQFQESDWNPLDEYESKLIHYLKQENGNLLDAMLTEENLDLLEQFVKENPILFQITLQKSGTHVYSRLIQDDQPELLAVLTRLGVTYDFLEKHGYYYSSQDPKSRYCELARDHAAFRALVYLMENLENPKSGEIRVTDQRYALPRRSMDHEKRMKYVSDYFAFTQETPDEKVMDRSLQLGLSEPNQALLVELLQSHGGRFTTAHLIKQVRRNDLPGVRVILLKQPKLVSGTDELGQTPLCFSTSIETTEFLLEQGASLDSLDHYQNTVYHHLIRNNVLPYEITSYPITENIFGVTPNDLITELRKKGHYRQFHAEMRRQPVLDPELVSEQFNALLHR